MLNPGECTKISPSVRLFFLLSDIKTPSRKIISPPELVRIKKIKYQPNLILTVINENKLIIPKFKPPELVRIKKIKYQPTLILTVINEKKFIIPKFKRTPCHYMI